MNYTDLTCIAACIPPAFGYLHTFNACWLIRPLGILYLRLVLPSAVSPNFKDPIRIPTRVHNPLFSQPDNRTSPNCGSLLQDKGLLAFAPLHSTGTQNIEPQKASREKATKQTKQSLHLQACKG